MGHCEVCGAFSKLYPYTDDLDCTQRLCWHCYEKRRDS